MRNPLIWFVGLFVLALIGGALYVVLGQKPVAVAPPPAPQVHYPIEKVLGTSVQGRKINAYTFGDGPKHIVFVGGIHGGYEWNSVLLAYQFSSYLTANPSIVPAGLSVTVIPDLNPDAMYKAIGKDGVFELADVDLIPKGDLSELRFNANDVDLNRNFDCKWASTGTWKSRTVSGGTIAFSEPESDAFRKFVLSEKPSAIVFWHSQAGAVYASHCGNDVLPITIDIMNAYAKASGYKAFKEFDAYEVHGASEDWLASIGIPAITVELTTHDSIEWEKNLAGAEALLGYFTAKQ